MKRFRVTNKRTVVNNAVFIVYANNDVDACNIAEDNMEGDFAVLQSTSSTDNSWEVEELGEEPTTPGKNKSNKKEEK